LYTGIMTESCMVFMGRHSTARDEVREIGKSQA
jgi:hypothetical protein